MDDDDFKRVRQRRLRRKEGGTSEPFRVLFLAISSLTAGRGIAMHPGRFWGTLKICSVRGNNTVLMTITSMHIIVSVCNVVLSAEMLEKTLAFPAQSCTRQRKKDLIPEENRAPVAAFSGCCVHQVLNPSCLPANKNLLRWGLIPQRTAPLFTSTSNHCTVCGSVAWLP